MTKVNFSVEMNEKLKNEFDEICEDLGLSPEEAVNIFAQKMVNEQGLPFELTPADYPYTEAPREKVRKVLKTAGCIAAAVGAVAIIAAFVGHDHDKR